MNKGYIDIYCERTGPEFWSEPVNAVTNFAFIISALFVAKLIRDQMRQSNRDLASWLFCALIFVIGIGSWLFHTHATRWALLADVIPIGIFILLYTWYALRRFAEASALVCGAGVMAVLAVAMTVPQLTGFRGGSYVAALLAMLIIGGYLHFARSHVAGRALLLAAGVFIVSLTLRTVDQPLCEQFPLGTHFGWHIFNAVVLFIATRAMVLYGRRI
ncbi:MAG: ceramidase domain-containing protein [Alphaproteobacteria bacterium]